MSLLNLSCMVSLLILYGDAYLAAYLLILKILLVIRKRQRELTLEGSEFFK